MDKAKIKLIAFDLDGTLTQHKSPLSDEMRKTLDALGKKYKLLMVGAGTCRRIFNQMDGYPIDIVGNYGMQFAVYNAEKKELDLVRDASVPADREKIEKAITALRGKYGFTAFDGDTAEYHPSGCVTFPLLGTKAASADKLAFDPTREKRRKILGDVQSCFKGYTVFVGGSSSFDMAPAPYNKAYALELYCRENGLCHDEVVYVGDDYGPGGNDESVYLADFHFIEIDDYRSTPEKLRFLL
ncbi:MAG: HAD-IIB family hydrolase [Clostridia bacterium]|nr:HAD-IIB family hydrolase [Clostridia bacterium]